MLTTLRQHWISWAYVILVGLLVAAVFYIPSAPQFEPLLTVEHPADAVLKIIDKLATLAAGLSTAFVAATLGLVIKGNGGFQDRSPVVPIAIMLVFLSAAISYFGIYLIHVRLITMIGTPGASAIDPAETQILWAVRMQFWGVVVEAIAVGFLIVRIVEAELAAHPTLVPQSGG